MRHTYVIIGLIVINLLIFAQTATFDFVAFAVALAIPQCVLEYREECLAPDRAMGNPYETLVFTMPVRPDDFARGFIFEKMVEN